MYAYEKMWTQSVLPTFRRQKNGEVQRDFMDSIIELLKKNGLQKIGSGDLQMQGTQFSEYISFHIM
jgi:hypothetical protein